MAKATKNAKGLDIIKDIIFNGTTSEQLELFQFDKNTSKKRVAKKFKIFARACYPRYFSLNSADFHDDVIMDLVLSYFGENRLVAGFRGCAKTSLEKLFTAFVLLNDKDQFRKYIKVLTKDLKNSKQAVTDVYNLIVEVKYLYGDQFANEGETKREETMGSFTMASGAKLTAGTIGQTQRGHIQDAFRPDWIIFDDTEDVKSVGSIVITLAIIKSAGEAIKGLSLNGSYFVSCNYISDQGVVQWFMDKPSVYTRIIPLLEDENDYTSVTWAAIPPGKVEQIVKDCKKDPYGDFYGEYQCDPTKAQNRFFDFDLINANLKLCIEPTRESAGVKYWGNYKPHHRYGQGSDHSEGVGLDANTLALFDFNTGTLIATYANNEITPDLAVYEFARVGREFGNCIYAPETNNKCGGTAITTLKQEDYPNIYTRIIDNEKEDKQTRKLGWETNSKTKYNMFFEFKRDYEDGLIKIYDKNVLAEMKAYTNNDLSETTTGLITRHFDLLTAVVIGWQMRKYAEVSDDQDMQSYDKAYKKYLNSNK